jgi:hypothetical protein
MQGTIHFSAGLRWILTPIDRLADHVVQMQGRGVYVAWLSFGSSL